jgi:hypothetical protein
MKKLVSGVILGSVLLAGSASPAFATGEGHTPVAYCHNGKITTTDESGAINGHMTRKGVHANDVFSEDLGGRPVEASDCLNAVERPTAPTPIYETTYHPDRDVNCETKQKIVSSTIKVTRYEFDKDEWVWKELPPEFSSSEATQPTTVEDCPVAIPPHGEPSPPVTEPTEPSPEPSDEAYPAPPVVTNTVNGAVVEPVEPAPSGVEAAAPAPEQVATNEPAQLANTGPDASLIVWASIGFLALLGGIFTVARVRRTA